VKQINKFSILIIFLYLHSTVLSQPIKRIALQDERQNAFRVRTRAARVQTIARPANDITKEGNSDEKNVADYAGNFSKGLEHDDDTTVLTESGQDNFKQLVKAISDEEQSDYNAVSREGDRKFANPQAANAFSLQGCDSSLFKMPAAPTLDSTHAAAEMIEVYELAYCRDVRFEDYGTGQNSDADGQGGSITSSMAAILQDLGSAYKGPRNSMGQVDASVLFRGVSAGDLQGPYVSQYLYFPLHPFMQPLLEKEQLFPIAQSREFGVSVADLVSIQDGNVPKPYRTADFDQNNLRHLITGRDMGTLVHSDIPGEIVGNAANILFYYGFPLAQNFPYENGSAPNEEGFATFGIADMYTIIYEVMWEALKVAWAQKWRAQRRLRPEAMSGLVHYAKTSGTNPYNLDQSLFDTHSGIDLLQLIYERNELQASIPNPVYTLQEVQTYVLALMYPEGSPMHPSYPAGHAVIAGACTAVVKAFFDDRVKLNTILDPVKPDPNDPSQLVVLSGEDEDKLTVGSELDKLASNIAIARNFAGVHYRADGDEGIILGEKVAERYLQDHGRMYQEFGFNGFEFTQRNGQRIRIQPDGVINI